MCHFHINLAFMYDILCNNFHSENYSDTSDFGMQHLGEHNLFTLNFNYLVKK